MRRFEAAVTMVALLVGCTSPASRPTANPSPQLHYTIEVEKEAGLTTNFRVKYVSSTSDCLIRRPVLGGDVVRTTYGEVLTAPAASAVFTIDLLLDEYLTGECGWRASSIQVSVNLGAYSEATANWVPLASTTISGSTESNRITYECRRDTGNAMWCKGPLAFVSAFPGSLRVTFTANDDLDLDF